MKILLCLLFASSCFTSLPCKAALLSLNDEEMSDVVGMQGIAVDLEFRLNSDANGAPLVGLSNCAGLNNPCKLAMKLTNRNSAGGEWLVFKDTYGIIKMMNLYLDATTTAAASTSYWNASRFQNSASVCIIASCTPNSIPALQLSFPGDTSTFENDILLGLNIGRIAIEYGATGYNNDARGSFLGVHIGDTSSAMAPAKIDVDGKIIVYGF